MTINLERSIHPDLLEETLEAAAEPAPPSTPPRRRRSSSAPSPAPEAPPSADGVVGDSAKEAPPSPPAESAPVDNADWLQSVRDASDPKEMLALLTKHLPKDEIARDEVLAGYIGDRVKWGIRDQLAAEEKQRQEHERQQAYDRGDLYTLGQLTATDLQQQRQLLEAQAQAAANPYLNAITNFQRTLPEAVQRDVQGKTYAPGGTPTEGFAAYLQAVHESALRHGLEDEVKKREGALRKVELSTSVGSEPTPELDGGPAQQYREITDAQVAAMDLEEFDRYFDDKGRPRPGVRVRLERGIDVRREQRR